MESKEENKLGSENVVQNSKSKTANMSKVNQILARIEKHTKV